MLLGDLGGPLGVLEIIEKPLVCVIFQAKERAKDDTGGSICSFSYLFWFPIACTAVFLIFDCIHSLVSIFEGSLGVWGSLGWPWGTLMAS